MNNKPTETEHPEVAKYPGYKQALQNIKELCNDEFAVKHMLFNPNGDEWQDGYLNGYMSCALQPPPAPTKAGEEVTLNSISKILDDLECEYNPDMSYISSGVVVENQSEIAECLHGLFTAALSTKEAEIARYRKALSEIVDPVQAMINRLSDEERLDGLYANMLSNDANYLKSIAKRALNPNTDDQK